MSGIFDQVLSYNPTILASSIAGSVTYKGTWDAATNSPTLANPPASTTKGWYYVVSAAGTRFGIDFAVGDWIISNGSIWQKVDLTDSVSSVFGRTGAVVATTGDYSASQISGLGSLATQNGTFSGTSSGTNTGDQSISITGDATAAASAGVLTATVTKINGTSLAGLATGILKNTTTTGVPSIAVAADFPTLNQNTTGTASNVTGTVAVANGGTGSTTASGARTNLGLGSLATQNGTFSGTSSGTNTGDQTISITGDVTASGSTGALTATVGKINGVALIGLGTGILKNSTVTGQPGIAVASDFPTLNQNTTGTASNVTGVVAVANGGTGASTLTGYVKGSGTAALTASSTIPNTDVTGLGTMSTQAASSVAITGGSINNTPIGASTPNTGAFTTLTASTPIGTASGGTGVNTTPSNGQVLIGNGTGYTANTLTAGSGITITNSSGGINIAASGGTSTQIVTATVTNAESVAITLGQVVYAYGATGNRMSVKLASNSSESTSSKTIGVVSDASIAANGTGTITLFGEISGLTLGSFTDGATLYLGSTAGSFTSTKPSAPNHLVYVGIVERANNGNGILYVKVQNGYELDEIHDVQITGTPAAGSLIIRDATNSLWKNATLTAGTNIAVTNADASVTVGITGTIALTNGGTGQTTAQAAINSLAGAVTSGSYLRGNGTNVVMNTIQAADVPTLNQSTTGSAATLTTPRAIYGNNFDGSAALTQVIASTYGGTGNGFTKFSGPTTAERTFTLPDSNATLLYSGGALGTPASGTVTNLTGTASININGTVGATTANTGAFTTLSASGTITQKGSGAGAINIDSTSVSSVNHTIGSYYNTGAAFAPLQISAGTITSYVSGSAISTLSSTGLAVTGALSATDTISTIKAVASAGNIVSIKNSTDTGGDNTRYAGVNFLVGSDDGTSSIRSYRTNSANNYETALAFLTNPSGATQTPTEKMRITSTGNVGIGTSSPIAKLHVRSSTSTVVELLRLDNAGNAADNGAKITWSNADQAYDAGYLSVVRSASLLRQDMIFAVSSNWTTTAPSEKMRITGDGLVGIGTSSPAYRLSLSGDANTRIQIDATTTQGIYFTKAGADNGTYRVDTNGNFEWYTKSVSQAMSLTASGNLLVGTTSQGQTAGASGGSLTVYGAQTNGGNSIADFYNTETSSGDNSPPLILRKGMSTTSSSARFVQFYASGITTAMGAIVGNGSGNVQFATLSDAREKTNIQSITGSLDKVLALKPVSFDWISNSEHTPAGFIAQDVKEVFPEFVVENMANEGSEQRYGLTGGLNNGVTAHLVKAIQELNANLVAELQSVRQRLAALESK